MKKVKIVDNVLLTSKGHCTFYCPIDRDGGSCYRWCAWFNIEKMVRGNERVLCKGTPIGELVE